MIPVLFLHHNQHACFVPSNKHFTSLFDSRQLFASSLYSLLAVCEPNTHWAIQSTFCVEKKIHRCEQVLTFLTETVEHGLITYSMVSPLCLGARALKNQYPHSVERRASAAWASNQWMPGQAGQTQDWQEPLPPQLEPTDQPHSASTFPNPSMQGLAVLTYAS